LSITDVRNSAGVYQYTRYLVLLTTASPCYTTTQAVYVQPTAAIPAVPAVPPTEAQINVSLNVGWNSYASSIGKLDAGKYLSYTIKSGTTGALLAVGYAGMEGSPISSFTHGLMTDISAIQVFEAGVVVATIAANAPGLQLRIARLTDGSIVYATDSGVVYTSTAPAYLPSEDLYVYGMLYSGYDEVSSAEFVTAGLVAETTATIAGAGSLSARPAQFVEASISGSGSFIASLFTTANINGAGAFSAVVERATESSIAGTGNFWVYAEASRPPTATIAGVCSLGASPFPTGVIAGIGSLSAFTSGSQSVTISGISHLTIEAYQGQLTESTVSGIGKLLTFADVGGRGYGELLPFVGVGGDTNYIQGYGTLPLFVSGATNGQSDYVPPELNRGYGDLPNIVGFAQAVDIGIGTGSAELSAFVGLAGDYDYGFASGNLPMLVGTGYGGFIADDEMALFSPVLGSSSITQQIDLVMILTSSGQLTSVLSMTREQALELLSALEQSSSFSLLGGYVMSLLSDARGASLESFSVNNRADLYDGGVVWVVNLDTNASTQYEQYGFNSFFRRGNDYYGVANDGIYKLSGDTDNGEPISALIDFENSNLGSTQAKRMSDVYIAASGSSLILKVVTAGRVSYYNTRWSGAEMKNQRAHLGKGLQSVYWQAGLSNQDGADFEVSGLEFLPIVTQRRT
jgi:hypothetical protein